MKPTSEELVERFKLSEKTPEERKEVVRRAGINSGKSRRRKVNLQKCLTLLIESEIPDTSDYLIKARESLAEFGIDATDKMTYGAAVSVAMVKRAMSGNVKAAEFVRDTAGFNPEFILKKEALNHQKKMDLIRLGQEEIQKADVGPLIAALVETNAEES